MISYQYHKIMTDNHIERPHDDDNDSMDEEEEEVRKPLFNDIFGVRGDYLKGEENPSIAWCGI